MKPMLRTLLTCCAAGALAVSLSACEPEDARQTTSAQSALGDGGYEPGWSMMDLAGVDPAFYGDDHGALPQALPMKSSYAGDYGEAAGYGYAPAYDYAPDHPDSHYQPLDQSYYYDEGPYEDGYLQAGYDDDTYYNGGHYSGGSYALGSDSNDYALLALAVALAGMLGDSPPDYGFAYDGVSPWAWQTSDRYYRYAEPIHGGYRYYYYEPDSYRPFLVSDLYYSYGYRGDRLAVIYDSAGRRVDARRAELQLRAAKAYYARAERLHRAAERDRFGVSAPLWERHRDRISRDRNEWTKVRTERPAWRHWEARNAPQLYRQWSGEALVRRDAERGFAKWQSAEYRTPAPTFYTKEARKEQVRNLAELRRERAEELAERRRVRAEQEIERQREVRRIAERTQQADLRGDRASQVAERREAAVERVVQQREARARDPARLEGNIASARPVEQRRQQQTAVERREQRQTAAAERLEEQRAEAQRRKERAAVSARPERQPKAEVARVASRQAESPARTQREAIERREAQQREQQARQEARQREQQAKREAQQREQQARREQAQAEASRQRAQAAEADRRAQREQARQEAETRRAQQAETRRAQQAEARQAQARQQAQAQREARQSQAQAQQQAQLAQARVTQQGQPVRQVAQARQEDRQQARQERQDEHKERREQRQNRN